MKYIKKSGYLQIMEIRHGLTALLIMGAGLVIILLTMPDQFASDRVQLTWLFFISAVVVVGFVLTRILVIRSDKFSAGIKAEQKVKKELSKLDNSFTVFHNFPVRKRGDIDFVVVGPTGVFSIEVKRRKMPTQYELDKFAYQSRKQAEALKYFISSETGEDVRIFPIVVLVDLRLPSGMGERGGSYFTTAENLNSIILSRQQVLYKDLPRFLDYLKKI